MISLDFVAGLTAGEAVRASGILSEFPELAARSNVLGVYGEVVADTHPLRPGDRVEIYRELARALASAGFDDAEVGVLLEVLDSFAIGNALEQRAPQQIWVDADGEGALARAMGSWSDPQALLDEAFDTGLAFLLDGMQARLRNRTPRTE